jgi:hypothetical protein
MNIHNERLFGQPSLVTLAVALVYAGSYLILLGQSLFGGILAAVSIVILFLWLIFSLQKDHYIILINILLLVIVYSPYVNYAKEIDGVRYFSSAYAIDFQQYLSVLWSLISEGVPFKNPYLLSEGSVYHYGFLMPLAVVLRYFGGTDFYNFFFLSNYLFIFQLATSLIFLQFLAFYFFKGNLKSWFCTISIMIFFSSYKWLFALAVLFSSGGGGGNFDTKFGFKTPANDFLFGSHYVFSMLFILYIFWYLTNSSNLNNKNQHYLTVTTACISSFFLPVINVFSLLVVFSLYISSLFADLYIKKDILVVVKESVIKGCIPLAAYLGYILLVAPMPNKNSTYLSFDLITIPLVAFSLIINFGPLIYLFIRGGDFFNKRWVTALFAISLLLTLIVMFRISSGADLDDSFNVSRRLGTSIGWLLLVNCDINAIAGVARWFIYPAALTFISQYAAFHVLDFRYDSRNERVASAVFDRRTPYSFDNQAWNETGRQSFNFDLIVGHASCGVPSSLGAFRYTSNLSVDKHLFPVNKCKQPNSMNIGFNGRYFLSN